AGQKPDVTTKATGMPLYLSNAFTFEDADQAARIFALEEGGYFYSRLSNPTVDALQQRMAALDGGFGAVAFASGTAAIMGLIMTVCETGDEIV
ncbi:PLP-dependent transferase, partial [Desulfovibrio desulfuricans]|nr:PLP-dependent transferase [Desulfovibrio desulfuricans]